MIVDAAPHGLSMLYQLIGIGEISNTDIQILTHPTHGMQLRFDYQHSQGSTEAVFRLTPTQANPKPASYQINDFAVNRVISLPDYQIKLQSDQETIKVEDPLTRSVQDFLAKLHGNLTNDETVLQLGANHLFQLIEHYQQGYHGKNS